MPQERLNFNPKEMMETDKWYDMTLLFAQSGGAKTKEDGEHFRWVKYPIKINGRKETYGWFLNPDYWTDGKLIAILGDVGWEETPDGHFEASDSGIQIGMAGIKMGATFQVKRFLWENPKTKKASQQFAVRYASKEWDTIVGATPESNVNPLLKGKADTPVATKAELENPPEPTVVDDAIALVGEVIEKYIAELKKVAQKHDLQEGAWERLYSHTHISTILINLSK